MSKCRKWGLLILSLDVTVILHHCQFISHTRLKWQMAYLTIPFLCRRLSHRKHEKICESEVLKVVTKVRFCVVWYSLVYWYFKGAGLPMKHYITFLSNTGAYLSDYFVISQNTLTFSFFFILLDYWLQSFMSLTW
jgi:hypothetical protein